MSGQGEFSFLLFSALTNLSFSVGRSCLLCAHQKRRCSVPGGTPRKTKETEKKAGKKRMREEDDDEDGEELRRYRKAGNEEWEWRSRMEKKMDEMENVGRFMMTNLGSLLWAMEGLKQEVTSLGKWIKEEIRDRNTERDESERDADNVVEGMGMEE